MSYKMKKVGTAHGVDLYVPCDSHGPDIRGMESVAQYASNMRRQQKEPLIETRYAHISTTARWGGPFPSFSPKKTTMGTADLDKGIFSHVER